MDSYDLTDGKEPVSHAEIDYLKDLANMLPENPVIVNIGAGVSTCAFLEARPDCFVHSVDVRPCPEEIENVGRCGLDKSRVLRWLGDSKVIGPKFPYECDLLFVDGDHWGVAADIEAWTGRMKPGGIMAFHDYQEVCAPNNPGSVYEHVNEGMVGYEKIGEVERVIAFRTP